MRARPSVVFVALTLLGTLLGIAGCGGSGSGTHMLDGGAWRLTEWTLNSLNPGDFTITAKFADGKITGNSGVNAYGGPYIAGPGEAFSVGDLAVGDLAVGAMGSIGPDMRAEQAYLTLLGEAKPFKRRGDQLTLFDRHGNESLIFQAATP